MLDWGAQPKDLDSYLNVPDADPAKRDCVINYKVPQRLRERNRERKGKGPAD